MPSPRNGGVIAKKLKGPPAKITLDRLANLVAYVSNGLSIASAASGVGISPTTAFTWQRRGRLELVRITDTIEDDAIERIPTLEPRWPTPAHWQQIPDGFDPVEWPFVVFAVALEKAQTAFEARALTQIQTAMADSWQAAAWLLERKFPERYGRAEARLKVSHEGPTPGSPVQVQVVSADDIEASFREILPLLPDIVDADVVEDDS